ncbi:hypothetical protein [Streptomyces sp. NBC_00853]|uniref:hypothetical protein n=1 Tax=Streptomyces sp. NBC_00853 TaxID=2903681 RepID=UPI0038736FBF
MACRARYTPRSRRAVDGTMAVVNENVSASVLHEHWVELAYIRGPSGREISTAVDNIEAV